MRTLLLHVIGYGDRVFAAFALEPEIIERIRRHVQALRDLRETYPSVRALLLDDVPVQFFANIAREGEPATDKELREALFAQDDVEELSQTLFAFVDSDRVPAGGNLMVCAPQLHVMAWNDGGHSLYWGAGVDGSTTIVETADVTLDDIDAELELMTGVSLSL